MAFGLRLTAPDLSFYLNLQLPTCRRDIQPPAAADYRFHSLVLEPRREGANPVRWRWSKTRCAARMEWQQVDQRSHLPREPNQLVGIAVAVVLLRDQDVLEGDPLPERLCSFKHLGQVGFLLDRHQGQTSLGRGCVEGSGQPELLGPLGQLLHSRNDPDGGNRDVAGADAQAL